MPAYRSEQYYAQPDNIPSYAYDDPARPRLTLRMLQKLRIKKDRDKREREEHLAFLPIMYADPPECDSKKKKKSKKSDDKIETHAMKLAMQAIKDKDKREQDAGKIATSSISE